MLEFVDSGLYFIFVQDENNFINPLLQVGSGSGSDEKSTGSGELKINGSDRIWILIPEKITVKRQSVVREKVTSTSFKKYMRNNSIFFFNWEEKNLKEEVGGGK